MKTRTRTASCFLSAPFGADTRILEAALKTRGFRVVDGRTLAPAEPLLDEIRKAIADASLVCVVAPSTLSVNTALELGMAVGIAKRLIAFAPLGTQFPSDLAGIMYCSAPLDDSKGIATFLDAFLAHGTAKTKPSRLSTSRQRKLSRAQSRDLKAHLIASSGRQFEMVVKELFERAGYVVSETMGAEDRGADFALWIDGLQYAFGNPVVVQVKDRLTVPSAAHTEQALRAAIETTRSRLGLLVYRTGGRSVDRIPSSPTWPLIVSLEVNELIKLLEQGGLEKELINLRNAAVHGVPAR